MHIFGHTLSYPMAEGATQRLNWAQFSINFRWAFCHRAGDGDFSKAVRQHAHEKDLGRQNSNRSCRQGVEACLFIGLPASVGMIVVRYPAVQFSSNKDISPPRTRALVALSTAIYSAAIWAFRLQQILNRAYYSCTTRNAVHLGIVNLSSISPRITAALDRPAESGMAVGTLVSFAIQAVACSGCSIVAGRIGTREQHQEHFKNGAASALMWIACVAVQYSPGYPHGEHKLTWAIELFALMGVGGAVYFGRVARRWG